jgi:cell wall-associated NlpC family hydrolase
VHEKSSSRRRRVSIGTGSLALSLGLCLCAGQLVATPAASAATPTSHVVTTASVAKAAVAKARAGTQTKYSTRTLRSGKSVRVTIKVFNPVNGKALTGSVRLQAHRSGKWVNWTGMKRLASGSASFSAAPKISGYFRVYYTGNGSFRSSYTGKSTVKVVGASRTTVAASSKAGTKILAEAKRHTGALYKFAAAGPSRFDCSGYTMYVYRKTVGAKLPHKANSQQHYGKAVAKGSKKVGDLIVYRSGSYGYHTGIYAGGGYMYDSPHTGARVGKHKLYGTNYVVRRLAA